MITTSDDKYKLIDDVTSNFCCKTTKKKLQVISINLLMM